MDTRSGKDSHPWPARADAIKRSASSALTSPAENARTTVLSMMRSRHAPPVLRTAATPASRRAVPSHAARGHVEGTRRSTVAPISPVGSPTTTSISPATRSTRRTTTTKCQRCRGQLCRETSARFCLAMNDGFVQGPLPRRWKRSKGKSNAFNAQSHPTHSLRGPPPRAFEFGTCPASAGVQLHVSAGSAPAGPGGPSRRHLCRMHSSSSSASLFRTRGRSCVGCCPCEPHLCEGAAACRTGLAQGLSGGANISGMGLSIALSQRGAAAQMSLRDSSESICT
mmetsp:Transcript_58154/g.104062  ORF Transcript_58154/g.104062 Transcript_58154/m.104062 type:complete len:282 (+) Transcript_58154:84-929(+)